jgi:hypothetical protein
VSGALTTGEVLGAGVAGAEVGAIVGSFVPVPIAGTVGGAAVGFIVGSGVAIGTSLLVEHSGINDTITHGLFHLFPSVFGG